MNKDEAIKNINELIYRNQRVIDEMQCALDEAIKMRDVLESLKWDVEHGECGG